MPTTRGTRRQHGRERVLLLLCLGTIVFVAVTCARPPAPGGLSTGPAEAPSPRAPRQVHTAPPDRAETEAPRAESLQPPAGGAHAPQREGPRVAIIIDDVGHNPADLEPFLALPQALTFAVLPGLAYSAESAARCREAEREVLLHLPMQPQGDQNPGPGAVSVGMEARDLTQTLQQDLAAVPGAVGVNNHMGSRATGDRETMDAVMRWAGERGLFFVDSVTGGQSQVPAAAEGAGVPSISRDVFLDGPTVPEEQMARQVETLGKIALRRGHALGIGHAHPRTAALLAEALPRLQAQGIRVVPVSELVGEGQ